MLVQREQSIRSRWEQMSTNALPNNTSAAEQQVVTAIDRWAQDSGVAISAITPQWKHDSDDYMTYECRVDAAGDLGKLSRFLYSVERDPMALKLELVELGARDKEGQQCFHWVCNSAASSSIPQHDEPDAIHEVDGGGVAS